MIRDLTWQTLTLVSTVWAIAGYLSDIEANSVPPPAAHDRAHADSTGSNDASALLQEPE